MKALREGGGERTSRPRVFPKPLASFLFSEERTEEENSFYKHAT